MGNLYVWIDESNRTRLERSIRSIAQRHPVFAGQLVGDDIVERLVVLMFPHGMPASYDLANVSLEDSPDENLALAVRPVLSEGHRWPLARGCSLVAKCFWPRRTPNPILMLTDVSEVSDSPPRAFERRVDVIVYESNPRLQLIKRTDNTLTDALAHDIPAISIATRERLRDWSDFLVWKHNLVREKMRGLRYTARWWDGDAIVFRVVGASEKDVSEVCRAISRQGAALEAFDTAFSSDPWVFRAREEQGGKVSRRGVPLGQPDRPSDFEPWAAVPAGCEWADAVAANLHVAPTEDDLNELSAADDIVGVQRAILSALPETGFLSLSAAGDLALIRRHENAIARLRDQGGYSPYLSSFLFDVRQATLPTMRTAVPDWFRSDLNAGQREAVEKILNAPDLCLVQGPPGTGKTTVIAEAIMQLARQGKRTLLVSQAHTAVDNALERLGLSPHVRAVRLARDATKVSEDGQQFVGPAALGRFYRSLAEHSQTKYLHPWSNAEKQLESLKGWLIQAEYAQRDLDSAMLAVAGHEREDARLREARDLAWQELQQRAQDKQKASAQRIRIEQAGRSIQSGECSLPLGFQLPQPQSDRLAEEIFRLADASVRLPMQPPDLAADKARHAELLGGLLRFTLNILPRLDQLERDLARLRAAGTAALRDPDVALRIAECEAEIARLGEAEDAPEQFERWKAKRRELKELTSTAGGLDTRLYQELFVDRDVWAAPVDDSSHVAALLSPRVEKIRFQGQAIELARKELVAALEAAYQSQTVDAVDESTWKEADERLSRHLQIESQVRVKIEQCSANARKVAEAAPLEATESGANEAREVLAACIRTCESQVVSLNQYLATQRDERSAWEEILKDWAAALLNQESAQRDWQHFGIPFVNESNVVAISCNENERTLEEAGHSSFDVVIIDEVSKATPLEMLGPLMRGRRAVLVGDHRQLPPLFQEGTDAQTFSDVVEEEEADGQDIRTSLTRDNLRRFERMVTSSLFKAHFEAADESIRSRLEIQFRMHPQIMSLVNHFYEQRLTCGLDQPDRSRAHGLTLVDKSGRAIVTPEDHVLWVDTTRDLHERMHREDMDPNGRPLRRNRLEAELIAHLLVQLNEQARGRKKKQQVGVVSFYAGQCRLIREAIHARIGIGRFDHLDVEINTVIRYQGKEKPIILVSLVRNDGFDPRSNPNATRMRSSRANVARFEFINVAFSRAQELLVVFGARSMYESYAVTLPNMDREGESTRLVYKEIIGELERNARVVAASRLMGFVESAPDAKPDVRSPHRGPSGGRGRR